MTEQEMYERIVKVREEIDAIVDAALNKPPTVPLCLFIGKLSAALDILVILEGGGVPLDAPDEESHTLS